MLDPQTKENHLSRDRDDPGRELIDRDGKSAKTAVKPNERVNVGSMRGRPLRHCALSILSSRRT
jgi:hypothetical protein